MHQGCAKKGAVESKRGIERGIEKEKDGKYEKKKRKKEVVLTGCVRVVRLAESANTGQRSFARRSGGGSRLHCCRHRRRKISSNRSGRYYNVTDKNVALEKEEHISVTNSKLIQVCIVDRSRFSENADALRGAGQSTFRSTRDQLTCR